jgi:hypothetical protein
LGPFERTFDSISRCGSKRAITSWISATVSSVSRALMELKKPNASLNSRTCAATVGRHLSEPGVPRADRGPSTLDTINIRTPLPTHPAITTASLPANPPLPHPLGALPRHLACPCHAPPPPFRTCCSEKSSDEPILRCAIVLGYCSYRAGAGLVTFA